MTRKIFLTDTPFPTSPEVIAEANAAGAGEIVHCMPDGSFPEAIRRLGINSLGFHEIQAETQETFAPISKMQVKLALHRAGLLATVQAMIAGHPDPEVALAWDGADRFHRNSPMIGALWSALGKTDAELDQLWRAAEQIAV